MKAIEIIQNEISLAHPEIHKTRLNTLFTFVNSGLIDQRLTVTYLGEALKSSLKQIKSMILNVQTVFVEMFIFILNALIFIGICRKPSL
mgnify:CR=1 FL=1